MIRKVAASTCKETHKTIWFISNIPIELYNGKHDIARGITNGIPCVDGLPLGCFEQIRLMFPLVSLCQRPEFAEKQEMCQGSLEQPYLEV